MKRYGHLFERIISLDNLILAHHRARRGKAHYREVRQVNARQMRKLKKLRKDLATGRFTTSPYEIMPRHVDGKDRIIYRLPYYPDRIVQHAVMNICAPIWERSLIRDTFQSIPGRGTSDARRRITRAMRTDRPRYALQIDIHKYYPSVDNERMKQVVRRSIKCPRTLALLGNIIDSIPGLPIGNYTSQIFGNLYLSEIDWWAKQQARMRYYYRYCDDVVVLHDCKSRLHALRIAIAEKLKSIHLALKPNWQVIDVHKQGLDFCGYVFYPNYTLLRRKIADNFRRKAREVSHRHHQMTAPQIVSGLMSYWGWLKPIGAHPLWRAHINGRHKRIVDGLPINSNSLRAVA